jgi:hypothetical protein
MIFSIIGIGHNIPGVKKEQIYFLFGSSDFLVQRIKHDEVVKSSKPDGIVKSFRCKARKSDGMRRTYLYAAMTEDAAQRRRWTFYEAVKHNYL